MNNPYVKLDDKVAVDTVLLNENPDIEARRIIPTLCQFCTHGTSARGAFFGGQECDLGILVSKSYNIDTKEVLENKAPVLRITVECSSFTERR